MRALSLTQPWATLVMLGDKRIETRSWQTPYRGWIAIHAAKGFPGRAKALMGQEPFQTALRRGGYPAGHPKSDNCLPRGAILGFALLHRVGEIIRRSDGAVMVRSAEMEITGAELDFGNYTPGRFGWRFSNLYRLPEPIPARGMLRLWGWAPPEGLRLPTGYGFPDELTRGGEGAVT